jgi:hypothetical protein
VFAHEINKSQKLLLKTGQTRWSGFIGSGGSQGEGQDPCQLKDLWWRQIDVNEVKMRIKENWGKKYERINSIDCVGVSLQSAMTYAYIGSKT